MTILKTCLAAFTWGALALPAVATEKTAEKTSEKVLAKEADKVAGAAAPSEALSTYCEKVLKQFPGESNPTVLKAACAKVEQLPGCASVQGEPIFHYHRHGSHKSQQRILVFSLIHGDETGAGTVGRLWMERLETIDPRNTWRVVPVVNPDGVKLKTRTNANKVDVNRNFPTQDWTAKAKQYWESHTKSNPRRYPGDSAASEPETKCAIQHFETFQPNFVVSIHTPLRVLDFDGPKVAPPKFDYLPWKSLGHYPGSLGRYLWFERKTPVLTTELRETLPKDSRPFVELQDIIGHLVSLEATSPKSQTPK